MTDYSKYNGNTMNDITAVAIGFAIGFGIFFVFYDVFLVSITGGVIFGFSNIFINRNNMIIKRRNKLRTQFLDMLEAISVAMRSGNPPLKALESARNDMLLIYSEDSDIIIEIETIIGKFKNSVLISEAFMDLAERSGIEDIESFASIYKTIEGKSNQANEIVREVQLIMSDKAHIEMEIETLMTASKGQLKIMLVMPLIILLMLRYMGAGFMDALYTTELGRLVATIGLIVLISTYFMGQKFATIQV